MRYVNGIIKKLLFLFSEFIYKIYLNNHSNSNINTVKVLLIENARIGDFIIKLPIYKRLIKEGYEIEILTNSKILEPFSKMVSSNIKLHIININQFLYNPFYRNLCKIT